MAAKTKARSARQDTYELITERLIDVMDRGEIPWRKTWQGGEAGMPRSLNTGRAYRGINTVILTIVGSFYDSPYWLTFKQAKAMGGSVRKGEKGTSIVFWSTFTPKDAAGEPATKKDGKPESRLFLKRYTVFNLEQTEDVCIPKGRELPERELPGGDAQDEAACNAAAAIFAEYTEREAISVAYGGGRACYSPTADGIRLPKQESFECAEDFHATSLHEATHSTGTSSRCARPGIEDFDYSGSHQYADEELVAEFGASFLCSMAGIDRDEQIENSAAYLASWKKRCLADPKLLIYAAQRAQKAADYILGETAGEAD